MKFVHAPKDARITLSHAGGEVACDLYSPEGRDLLAALWSKVGTEHRHMYEPSWLGVPIIQFPEDIVMMQELLWRLRPDAVIETGVAHGGSLLLTASILELIGHGHVLGIDVEIRKYNRVALDAHPLRRRIHLYEGSSVDAPAVEQARSFASGAQRVLVVLDSNHSADHVAKELELYAPLVTPGSYIVAMDGLQAHVSDIPRGKPEWKDDHPIVAIRDFLARHPEFELDEHYTRLGVTSSPEGFLRRRTSEEMQSR
jgi:cephalosporin hydroxylase